MFGYKTPIVMLLGYGLFTPPTRRDKTVLSGLDLASMSPRWRCEHNCRQDKTVLSRLRRQCEQAITVDGYTQAKITQF